MRAEEYIKAYTRNCSNEMDCGGWNNGEFTLLYHPWLTPENALEAVRLAREELTKEVIQRVDDFIEQAKTYISACTAQAVMDKALEEINNPTDQQHENTAVKEISQEQADKLIAQMQETRRILAKEETEKIAKLKEIKDGTDRKGSCIGGN